MTLVRIVKEWDVPDLLRQTPGGQGIWDGIRFTMDPISECDYLILLNNRMSTEVHMRCARKNVWTLMQEPYVEGYTDWMVWGHKSFARVYTHYIPSDNSRYRVSQPAVPWHVNRNFDQLAATSAIPKSKRISWITSNRTLFPGHRKRMALWEAILKDGSLEIDIFGRGICHIEDKWDGLAPYAYSLAIENYSGPDYWTEKLADCFLSWTIPIYYGCTNLEDYFPADSFIRIDIESPNLGVEQIKRIAANDDWDARLNALEEARNLYLHRYQFFPYVAELIRSSSDPKQRLVKTNIKIPAYKKPLIHRIARKLRRLLSS